MIIQVVWLLLAIIVGSALCVVFTFLGRRVSSVLTFQYENWRNHRNDDVKYRPKERSKQRIGHHSKRGIVKSVTDFPKHDKDDNGNKESDKQTYHEASITGGK